MVRLPGRQDKTNTRLAEASALLIDSARQWALHRASSKGAALALYMVFSLAPMLILLIAVAGAFFGEETVRLELFSHLRDLIGERGADLIQSVLASAHNAGSGRLAALISLAMMVFSATTAFSELKASLDELWETPPQALEGWKSLIYSRLLSFGLVLTLAVFLLLSLMLNAGLQIARSYYLSFGTDASFTSLAVWISSLFSFAMVSALFAVTFKLLPNAHTPWRAVLPGAMVTAALFAVGKWGIGLYLSQGATVSAYGAAGSLLALLLWIYYCAQIFFFGAVFTRQLALRAARKTAASQASAV